METIQEVLDFAVQREEEAAAFYAKLADMTESADMKRVLQQFSAEEEGHAQKLKAVKAGKIHLSSRIKVPSLGISDSVEKNPNIGPEEMTYRDALILAMDREEASCKMYTDLAEMMEDPAIRDIFLALAQEEAKHKLRFEIEYDEAILGKS